MSFYDIETGSTTAVPGADRRKDDRAALAAKLKAKLRELQACGLPVDFEADEGDTARRTARSSDAVEVTCC
jgi:hypothetical protein